MSGAFTLRFEAERVIAAFLRAPRVIEAELERTVELGAVDFEGAVVSHTPVGATGMLRNSMTYDVSGSGILIVGRVYSTDVPVKVISVEEGRRPGRMPPRAPIELWVRRKLGGDGSLVFLIQRAIGRRGTKGAHMFRDGFNDGLPRVQARVNDLMRVVRSVL